MVTQAHVEHPDDQADVRVQLLRHEGGVHVADVVLVEQGEGAGGADPGAGERPRAQPLRLDQADPGDAGDLGAVVALPGREDHRHG